MAYVTNEEMNTHLYAENVNIISRGDTTIMTAAIDAAVQEARGYLAAYDTPAIFSAAGGDRNALLVIFVKDIAAWHFLILCNAGHEFKVRQDRYDRAIAWLRLVQKGDVSPDLPGLTDDAGNAAAGTIISGSNPKRTQHF
jgi:phage gp36-like protein